MPPQLLAMRKLEGFPEVTVGILVEDSEELRIFGMD
jgi:hypothetical protein